MQRRNFLKAGLAAGTATLAAGCGSPTGGYKAANGQISGSGGARGIFPNSSTLRPRLPVSSTRKQRDA